MRALSGVGYAVRLSDVQRIICFDDVSVPGLFVDALLLRHRLRLCVGGLTAGAAREPMFREQRQDPSFFVGIVSVVSVELLSQVAKMT